MLSEYFSFMDTKILLIGLVAGLLVGVGAGYVLMFPQVSSLQGKVDTLQAQADLVPGLQNLVSGLTDEKIILQGQVSTLRGQVSSISGQLATLQTQVSGKDAEITSLRAQVDALMGMVPPLPPTSGEAGSSRFFPAPIGSSLTVNYVHFGSEKSYTAVITVLQVTRGTDAWTQIQAASMFNVAPQAGYEYLMARVRFSYVTGPTLNTLENASSSSFRVFSGTGLYYDAPFIVAAPAPRFDASLYPGNVAEGWCVFKVSTSDPSPMMSFAVSQDGSGGIWFQLY
jgi:hypothetical protein